MAQELNQAKLGTEETLAQEKQRNLKLREENQSLLEELQNLKLRLDELSHQKEEVALKFSKFTHVSTIVAVDMVDGLTWQTGKRGGDNHSEAYCRGEARREFATQEGNPGKSRWTPCLLILILK